MKLPLHLKRKSGSANVKPAKVHKSWLLRRRHSSHGKVAPGHPQRRSQSWFGDE